MNSDYGKKVSKWLQRLNDADEQTQRKVILSVGRSTIPIQELIPVLETGLKHSSDDVRLLSTMTAFQKGRRLSSKDVLAFESEVESEDLELTMRLLLIGYYCRTRAGIRRVTKEGFPHVRCIIENASMSEAARMPETTWFESPTCQEYEISKQLWLDNLASDPENVDCLKNAASFFAWHERELSHDCLAKGQSLEPWNAYWSQMLASGDEDEDEDTDHTAPVN